MYHAAYFRRAFGGFSLVELSIVLVILGLLVGGVLGGQSLIEAAKIRSQIAQIDGFRAAVNTFQLKRNFLPGDFPPEQANPAGFTARTNFYQHNYGNGKVIGAGNQPSAPQAEVTLFWNDLAQDGLVSGSFANIECYYGGPTCVNVDTVGRENILPAAKILGNYVSAFSEGDKLQYIIVSNFSISTSYNGYWEGMPFPGLTPEQAYGIDSKVDDGHPQFGSVASRSYTWAGDFMGFRPSAYGGSDCNSETAYTVANSGKVCGISIRH